MVVSAYPVNPAVRNFTLLALLVWTLVLGLAAFSVVRTQDDKLLTNARTLAKASSDKDIAYRHWAARHGGVYVPLTAETPANPDLHVPEQTITTPSGKQLTLLNPAYITRQVYEDEVTNADVPNSHLTSLNPIRLENTPDNWEVKALQRLENGAPEYGERVASATGNLYRFIRPLWVDESCLPCHAAQGYKSGDLRGGISTRIPLATLEQTSQQAMSRHLAVIALIWLTGLFGTGLAGRKLQRSVQSTDRERATLDVLFEAAPAGMVLFGSDLRAQRCNTAFKRLFKIDTAVKGQPCGEILKCVNRRQDGRGCGFGDDCQTCSLRQALDLALVQQQTTFGAECQVWRDAAATPCQLLFNIVPVEIAGQVCALCSMTDISDQKALAEKLTTRQLLLEAINHAQRHFITEDETRSAFEAVLTDLLTLTESRYGFVGEVLYDKTNQPYLHTHAISNIAWNQATQDAEQQASGMEFYNLKTLFGAALSSGQPVIANNPAQDPRRGGLPEGHPALDTFMGLPIEHEGRLVAMIGLANRSDGYTSALIEFLQPLLATIAQLVIARRGEQERCKALAQLVESEAYYRGLIDHVADAICVHEVPSGRFIDCNQQMLRALGYSREELLQLTVYDVDPASTEEQSQQVWREHAPGTIITLQSRHKRKDGSAFPVEVKLTGIDQAGSYLILATARDLSERIKAEHERDKLREQLLQAQKIDSIGRLAGGVAHDFNNMLAAILGNTEMAQRKLGEQSPASNYLQQIKEAANRSADLTRQLLGFARKQPSRPEIIDLNLAITETLKMLRRLIGEDLKLLWTPMPEPALVKVDPTQLNQILVNLAVNARDAMPDSGTLAIGTEATRFDEQYCREHPWCQVGNYVCLTFSDTGHGMSKLTQQRIFEPFFTTKEVHKGTGLGLSTVYGIVKQNRGSISVYSEPGQGTTFKICFPAVTATGVLRPIAESPQAALGGSETLLFVEDEPMLLDVGVVMLEAAGYKVLSAGNPAEAIRLVEEFPEPIDLLVTDMVMPGMTGKELSQHVADLRPGLKTLYMSGYAANIMEGKDFIEGRLDLLSKPFSNQQLTSKVREMLDKG